MERSAGALYGIAGGLLLLGLVLRIFPAPAGRLTPVGAESVPPQAVPLAAPGELPEAAASIIRENIFSPSRAAPRVRFTPPDLLPSGVARSPGPSPSATRLRLFGTVVGPSGTAALIDADPAVRGAEIYQVGDLVKGKRVVAVSESTVVLTDTGRSGRMVLRLRPALPTAR
jgi:hypothetical protein